MGAVPNGQGRVSRKWTSTHRFKAGGYYWRTEEDYKAWRVEQNKIHAEKVARLQGEKKPNGPSNRKGSGLSCTQKTPTHQYYAWGRYWVSREAYEEKRKQWLMTRNAVKNEISIDHQMEIEVELRSAVNRARAKEQKMSDEFMRLKLKHGLPRGATRMALKNVYARTLDPEIKQFFHLESTVALKADERLHAIRELFLSGLKPQEILYRTAIMVGVAVKEKQ